MKLVGNLKVGGKTFTMQDSIGTVYLKDLGLPDNFYGGYVREARKTEYGIYMLVSRKGDIVNLGYTERSLTEAGKNLLGLVASHTPVEVAVKPVVEVKPKSEVKPKPAPAKKPAPKKPAGRPAVKK